MRFKSCLLGILLAGMSLAGAEDLTGKVVAMEGGLPMQGAKVKLLLRKDSTYSGADGTFRLPITPISVRPLNGMVGGLDIVLEGSILHFLAEGGADAQIDLFDLHGKRLISRGHRPATRGRQRLDLGNLIEGLSGLIWLRVKAGSKVEWIRVLDLGSSGRVYAKSIRMRSGATGIPLSESEHGGAQAKRSRFDEVMDTILVEMPGYYSKIQLFLTAQHSGYEFHLWKNSVYGLDSAEIRSWKEYFTNPGPVINLGRSGIVLPANRLGGAVVAADGKEVANWSMDPCRPGPFPKALHLHYDWQGKEYRDTLALADFWALKSSFTAVPDSMDPFHSRFQMAWTWPGKQSRRPDRDWMELFLTTGMEDNHSFSYPDVYQYGVQFGIEGGLTKYGEFKPADGAWAMSGNKKSNSGFRAHFTVASREGHDLRVRMEHRIMELAADFEFTNPWPAGGTLRSGQVLRLQARSQPAVKEASLQWHLPSFTDWSQDIDEHWDGTGVNWAFSYPLLDTVIIRLRAKEAGSKECPATMESPDLKIAPDPGDPAVGAYEPNETPRQAALVPKGAWIRGAWDFRLHKRGEDTDYFRFQAAKGEKVRITLRNPNSEVINLNQEFSNENSGFGADPGQEFSITYAITASGDQHFQLQRLSLLGGRYEFRIDPAN